MRLRTLPVSTAGVILAFGYSLMAIQQLIWLPAILCLSFAILAQIASNFANEYYDFRNGLDKPGRDGPRRGVTEGEISPQAMRNATFATLAVACLIGLSLIYWGGWWLLPAGVFIALGVVAYSAGPYPLSHHGLGELAVVLFFGIIPVNLTFYVLTGEWSISVVMGSVTAGLMGANVLIVNNYRDMDDDRAVGKRTLAVILGRRSASSIYLLNGLIAMILVLPLWMMAGNLCWTFPVICMILHVAIWRQLTLRQGTALNPLLGMTSMLMLFYCTGFTLTVTYLTF